MCESVPEAVRSAVVLCRSGLFQQWYDQRWQYFVANGSNDYFVVAHVCSRDDTISSGSTLSLVSVPAMVRSAKAVLCC